MLGFGGVSLNSRRFASLKQTRALIRQNLRSSAHPEGNLGSGHPHGPLLRCAALGPERAGAARRDGEAERSKGPCGCSAAPPLLAAPAGGRLRGGMGVGAPMLRDLTRRSCPSGAPQARSEFCGAPRKRTDAGLPLRNAKGSQTGGRLSFGYFSLAKQRTSTSAAGPRPGLRPQHKHAFQTSTTQLRQAQTERPKPTPIATKIIATTA